MTTQLRPDGFIKRETTITIRVSDTEKAMALKLAEQNGTDVSTYIRQLLLQASRGSLIWEPGE